MTGSSAEVEGDQLALVFTDIEGSTRLLYRLGSDDYAQCLGKARDFVRAVADQYGGIVVSMIGDASFITFPSAAAAARAMIDLQTSLYQADSGGFPIRMRVGIHLGRPRRTANGYVGMEVHEASRIGDLGHGGQIVVSDTVASAIAAEAPDVSCRELGIFTLRDVTEPRPLFQIDALDLEDDFPPLRARALARHNLPSTLTPFIGRDALVEELQASLRKPGSRLTVLTGPGGTGKTRLAVRLGELLHGDFYDGVFFVALAAMTDPGQVISQIAAVLDVSETSSSVLEHVIEAIQSRELMLILDNFEQVTGAAPVIARLAAECPQLKVIITSRIDPRIAGSKLWQVPTLSLPDRASWQPEQLADAEAVRLFIEYAQLRNAEFDAGPDGLTLIAEICERIDKLPLAIELAAIRTTTLPLGRLLASLSNPLRALSSGYSDSLSHHQGLAQLVAWSFDLLTPDEQTLWTRLAIFNGGIRTDAADEVCNLEGGLNVELDAASLAAQSMLKYTFPVLASADPPRLQMLSTLREYASGKLKERAGEFDTLATRHRQWFTEFAATAAAHFRGAQNERWLSRLDVEVGNLRDALLRNIEAEDATAATALAANLWFFWYQKGRLSEGREWLGRVLAAFPDATDGARAECELGAGQLARHQNDLTAAEAHLDRAVELFEAASDDAGIAAAYTALGSIKQRQGDTNAAIGLLEDALQRFRSLEDPARLSSTLNTLGAVRHEGGQLDTAEVLYSEALAIGRESNDKNTVATSLVNLGEIAATQGDTALALQYYGESLTTYADLGLLNAIAYCFELFAPLTTSFNAGVGAELMGAAAKLRDTLNTPIESFNADRLEKDRQLLADALGPGSYQKRFDGGYGLSLDDALDLAISVAPAN